MFEKLTADEAAELNRRLNDGYTRSRVYARECVNVARRTEDYESANCLYGMAVAQAGMRQEITSIRWQIKAEVLQS